MGNALLICFGYHRAHENDAERAIRAGLVIAEAGRSMPIGYCGRPPRQAASMRPLIAHCHHGLGTLYRLTGGLGQPAEHLDAATALYTQMDMRRWREQADPATG